MRAARGDQVAALDAAMGDQVAEAVRATMSDQVAEAAMGAALSDQEAEAWHAAGAPDCAMRPCASRRQSHHPRN